MNNSSTDNQKEKSSDLFSVSDKVYEYLKKAINKCRYIPGDKVSENEIARDFEVSRQPVREALIRLASDDFVQIKPKSPTRVKKISRNKLYQNCEIRGALEAYAISKAMQIANRQELVDKLNEILKKQITASLENDLRTHIELDDLFHKTIIVASGLPRIWDLVQEFKGGMDRIRYLSISYTESPMKITNQHHKAIINAIATGDIRIASDVITQHIDFTKNALKRIIDISRQKYFED